MVKLQKTQTTKYLRQHQSLVEHWNSTGTYSPLETKGMCMDVFEMATLGMSKYQRSVKIMHSQKYSIFYNVSFNPKLAIFFHCFQKTRVFSFWQNTLQFLYYFMKFYEMFNYITFTPMQLDRIAYGGAHKRTQCANIQFPPCISPCIVLIALPFCENRVHAVLFCIFQSHQAELKYTLHKSCICNAFHMKRSPFLHLITKLKMQCRLQANTQNQNM